MDEEEWRSRLIQAVAQQVRRRRLELGLSVQKVADICTEEYGLPIKRSVLANFEGGRRPALSVVELIVLARILKTSPVELLFPVGRERQTEALPDTPTDTWEALKWFTGETDRLPGDTEATSDTGTVRLYRDHDRLVEEWRTARNQVFSILAAREPKLMELRAEGIPVPEGYDAQFFKLFLSEMQNTQNAVRLVRQDMRTRGLIPPDLGPADTAVLDGDEGELQEFYRRIDEMRSEGNAGGEQG